MFGPAMDFETKIVRYASFSQVIGAAIGGAGLALGRSPLIRSELASGRLVRLFPDLSRPGLLAVRAAPRPVAPPPHARSAGRIPARRCGVHARVGLDLVRLILPARQNDWLSLP